MSEYLCGLQNKELPAVVVFVNYFFPHTQQWVFADIGFLVIILY